MLVEVEYTKIDDAAREIESFVTDLTSSMRNAGSAVNGLTTNWQGKDSNAYRSQWQTVEAKGSTYMKMKESLESYADFLHYASGKYKKAQTDAVNRANLLKWF